MSAKRLRGAQPIPPGGVIGVFGSGQLGRMLGLACAPLGYRLHVFSPDKHSPAGQVAARELVGDYADRAAVRRFVRGVDVVTFEFENVPALVADVAAEEGVPVRPAGSVLHTAQQRVREKRFLAGAGLPVAPFKEVYSLDDVHTGLRRIGVPAVLKTAAFGYDGKGQVKVEQPEDAAAAWQAVGAQDAVLEAFVQFDREISVVAARGVDGAFAHYGAIENAHQRHILDVSVAPARIAPRLAADAVELAHAVMDALGVVGVLCVEMFAAGERLYVNEIAPRPHNSGHLTIEAAPASQFEQQARAVCGLPLGDTRLRSAAAMANLLGDLWENGEPDWAAALAMPGVKLHLYGKREARSGRKMGHLTALAATADDAEALVRRARVALRPQIPVRG